MTNSIDEVKEKSPNAKGIYMDGSYLAANSTWHVEDSPWKAEQIAVMLSRNGINANSVCEVGCGAGEILRQLSLKMPSKHYVGYELSPQAFELCQKRTSENLHFYSKNILDEDAFFDVLLCIDVFEHVEDYIGFLRALRPKATYKIFHVPLDISVQSVMRGSMMKMRQSVGHLHYFTPATAIATLQDAGYEIVDHFYTRSFDGLESKSWKAKLARIPRKILFSISPDLMVKVLGGCSLMILTK